MNNLMYYSAKLINFYFTDKYTNLPGKQNVVKGND